MSPPAQTKRLDARQRLAAERRAAVMARQAAARRKHLLRTVGAPVAAVLAVLAALVIVKVATGAGAAKSGQQASVAPHTVVAEVTSVPSGVFDRVGTGTARQKPASITAPALTSDAKPLVLYVGAEYCPYCATERWAVAVALSRFGTFTGLGQTASAPDDVYPNTATLTFHDASYSSHYLSFAGKEMQSNQVTNGHYATLDKLSPSEEALVAKYDAPPYVSSTTAGSIPFIDLGGRYVLSGASYDPEVLQGKPHAQIAAALSDPSSAIAQGADGTANLISAALCRITASQPATVCRSRGVTTAAAALTR